MVFFHKNKRQFGFRSHRKLFVAIFLLLISGVSGIVTLILNVNAQTVPVASVELFSEHSSYQNNEPGAWKITKSAKWTDLGKARITFEVESVAKYDIDKKLDVLMVIDNSGSMEGDKMAQVKADATDLIKTLLVDTENKVALVKFNSEATILSGFSNDKTAMLEMIDSIDIAGCTNYFDGLLKAEEVLEGYEREEDRELILLFLTDGYPNMETPNEIAQYHLLKDRYPYMTINGIQYEMGDTVLQPIINVSDHQFIANIDTLNNVLFEATIIPHAYNDFVITDYVNDEYWSISGLEATSAELGEVTLEYDSATPKITWDMSGLYRSGKTVILTIDIDLKPEFFDVDDLFLPTNKREEISSSMTEVPDEYKDSNDTPILKDAYHVIYDANAPDGCEPTGEIPAMTSHTVFTTVEISDNQLTCSGYSFKGWKIAVVGIKRINDDYFRMPEKDVHINAVWSKLDISKTMDGTVHEKGEATLDNGRDVNAKLKKLSGQSSAGYTTYNDTVTAFERSDILPTSIDPNDTAHIISTSDSQIPIYAWYDEGKIYYYSSADIIIANRDLSYLFYGFGLLASLDGISGWDTSNTKYMNFMFGNVGRSITGDLSISNISDLDISNVTEASSMFNGFGYNAASVTLDLSNWDTSSLVKANNMFYNLGYNSTSWSVGNLSGWDVSNVTNMSYMFSSAGYNSTSWSVGNLSGWDVSKVTNMSLMFQTAGRNSTSWSVGDLSGWDVSNVTTMSSMFSSAGYNSASWSIGDISGWDVSKVTTMSSMFYGVASNSTSWSIGDLSGWDVSNVTNMSGMFNYAGYNSTTWSVGDLSGWDVSKVTNMSSMLQFSGYNSTSWSIGDISGWDVSNVTNMSSIFNYAGYKSTSWSVGDLSGWDVSNVTNMNSMFSGTGYNTTSWSIGDISGWDVSKVTNMGSMFHYAGYKSTSWSVGDLSGWDVSNVTNMHSMFSNTGRSATSWSVGDLSGWDTSKVTDMSGMFQYSGYSTANWSVGDISHWNTSSVTNVSFMFISAGYNATNFSLDLSGWDTSNVTSLSHTFHSTGYNSTDFSLNLSGWDTSKVTDMNNAFALTGYRARNNNWSVIIPATNGGGIENTTTMIYGNSTSVYYSISGNGVYFTLAEP